jgi:hypothetical protein
MIKELKAPQVFHSAATLEQYELFLATYYRTYQQFKINGTTKQQDNFKKIATILEGLASRVGIKNPEAVVWGDTDATPDELKRFSSANEARKSLVDFYRAYKSRLHWNRTDEKEVEKLSSILLQDCMTF